MRYLLLAVLLVAFACAVQADTHYVNLGDSIQAAITAADPGDTVQVAPGTYNEALTINKRLILAGAGSGGDPGANTIITPVSGIAIVLTAGGASDTDRLVIRDLRITGASGGGIAINGANSSHLTFENLAIVANAGRGINTNGPSGSFVDIILRNCNLSNNTDGFRTFSGFALDGLQIIDCTVNNNSSLGVYLVGVVTNFIVQGGTFNGNADAGIHAQLVNAAPLLPGVVDLSGFTANGNARGVVMTINGGTAATLSDITANSNANEGITIGAKNTVSGLTIEDVTVQSSSTGKNLWVLVHNGATLSDVSISRVTTSGNTGPGGMWIWAIQSGVMSGVSITDCAVTGNTTGIFVDAWPGLGTISGVSLSGNIFSANGTAVKLSDRAVTGGSADNNSFSGNTVGLQALDVDETFDAENNWWGKPSGPGPVGPGMGDKVSTNVDYDPWLGKPAHNDVLYLVPQDDDIFIQPGESILVDMNVANLTEMVTGCQAMLGYSSTYFKDPTDQGDPNNYFAVAPGSDVWDTLIYDSWKVGEGIAGEIDTAIGVEGDSTTGTSDDGTVAKITLTSRPLVEGVTQMVFRTDVPDDLNKQTYLSDMNIPSQQVWPAKVNSTNIYIDGTKPLISVDSAVEGSTVVLDGANTTLQGTVVITVSASDALAGLDGAPTVTVTKGADVETLTTTDTVSPFTYNWVVGSSTANGAWSITATATDKAGNTLSDTNNWLVVNKNRITGTITLEGFVGGSRDVALYINGTVAGHLLAPLSFVGDSAGYTLVDVPGDAITLSAKTAWSLREKLTLTGGADNQWTADFIADAVPGWNNATDHYLRGGDLDGTNSINILDYSTLKQKWAAPPATVAGFEIADIDGDGSVYGPDYTIMKLNWFKTGDLQ